MIQKNNIYSHKVNVLILFVFITVYAEYAFSEFIVPPRYVLDASESSDYGIAIDGFLDDIDTYLWDEIDEEHPFWEITVYIEDSFSCDIQLVEVFVSDESQIIYWSNVEPSVDGGYDFWIAEHYLNNARLDLHCENHQGSFQISLKGLEHGE